MKLRRALTILGLILMTGCAGMTRSCSAFWAEEAGADWIVVQYGLDGKPFNCWKLESTSIANESGSDGIYWKEPSGHLVHISGWYNRVQVRGKQFDDAAKLLGVDVDRIQNGKYN